MHRLGTVSLSYLITGKHTHTHCSSQCEPCNVLFGRAKLSNSFCSLRRSSGCWDQRDGWDHYDPDSSPRAESCTMSTPVSEYAVRRRPTRPALFVDQPDLTALIDTNFSELPLSHTPSDYGFNFGGLVEKAYKEHEVTPPPATMPTPLPPTPPTPPAPPIERLSMPSGDWESSVWSMELRGNLIAAGRSNGKLEVTHTHTQSCTTLPSYHTHCFTG